MKKTTYLLGALMIAGLGACTQSDDLASLESSLSDSSTLVQITTSGSNVTTRFDGTTGFWESGDAIGVYMTSTDGTTQGSGYDNVEYTLSAGDSTSTGTFTASPGILKPDDGVSVNFYAYYPYSDAVEDSIFSLDISDQSEGFKDYDLMYATKGSVTSDDLDDGLSLEFAHKVAKATIKVFTDLTLTGATISGVPTAIDFTINGGTSETTTESGTITPYGGEVESEEEEDSSDDTTTDSDSTDDSDDDSSSDDDSYQYLYEAILIPMSDISNLTLKFETSDGLIYKWQPTDLNSISAISAGYEYVFGIYIDYSASTGSSSNYVTELTATGTPFTSSIEDNSYYTEGLSGNAEVSSYADEIGISCVIDVDASSTDLSSLLTDSVNAGYTAIALRFTASSDYSNSYGAITIPTGLNALALICDNTEAASINLNGLSNSSTLDSLYLYNLDITGTSGTSFVYQCDITDIISVVDCSISSVDALFYLNYTSDSTDSLVFIVDNSVINSSTLITGGVVYCSLTNSTFTLTSYLIQAEYGVQACAITVDACTFDVNSWMFSAPSSYESTADSANKTNSLSFSNSVVAFLGNQYFYNKIASSNCTDGGNNYYVSSDDSTNIYATIQGGTANNPSTLTSIATKVSSYSTLFSATANASHSLTSPTYWLTSDYSDYETGDPRWYYSNYSE